MRNEQRETETGSRKSWWRLSLSALALGLCFALDSTSFASSSGPANGGRGTDAGGDDETIGTLPILGSGPQLDLVRHMRDARPSFFVQGAFDDVLSALAGVEGDGSLTVDTLPNGHVRIGFHGRTGAVLQRGLVHTAGLTFGTYVPAGFQGAHAWQGMQGQVSATPTTLGMGIHTLPVSVLDQRGALDQSRWMFAARSDKQGNYQFRAWSEGSLLRVQQSD